MYFYGRKGLVDFQINYEQFGEKWAYEKDTAVSEFDLCFITTKSYDIENAFLSHLNLIKKSRKIIFFTNGYTIDLARKLESKLNGKMIEFGVTDRGIVKEDGIFKAKSKQGTFRWSSKNLSEVENYILNSNDPKFSIESNPSAIVFGKFVKNVVINSITAAYSLERNGLVDTNSVLFQKAFDEAYDLATSLFLEAPINKENLQKQTASLVESTKDNFNSMAYDRSVGRKTESDFLAGIAMGKDGYPTLKQLHIEITSLPTEADPLKS